MRKKQKFYYLFKTGRESVYSYTRVMYAESSREAEKMFFEEYHNKFGYVPNNVRHRRVDKTTYEIINHMEDMPREFKVLVTEELQKVVTVTAKSENQAKEIAIEMYKNEEIVLSADDFYDHTIEILP